MFVITPPKSELICINKLGTSDCGRQPSWLIEKEGPCLLMVGKTDAGDGGGDGDGDGWESW